MALTSAPRWFLAIVLWTACREISVCTPQDPCDSSGNEGGRNPTEGGRTSAGGVASVGTGGIGDAIATGGAGGATQSGPGGSNQGGAAGGALTEASAGAAGALMELPQCESGTAECDGSTFTRCETPLSFSCRHCGGCNQPCQGACSSGQCDVAERILLGTSGGFVATSTLAFTLILGESWNSDLYQIELQTGQARRIAENLDIDNQSQLAVGSDRLYVPLRSGQVMSMNFDGTLLTSENFEATTIAGTADGVYYTNSDSGGTLWYKPAAGQHFEPLLQGASCTIRAASRTGIVVQLGSSDTPVFSLVRAGQVAGLIGAPLDLPQVQPVGDGAVALVSADDGSSVAKLLWLFTDRQPRSFTVGSTLVRSDLVAAPNGVALELEEQGTRFVQLFTSDGPGARIGVLHGTELAFVDEQSLWFDWVSSLDLNHGLMRASASAAWH